MKTYVVYLLRRQDGSYYVGITNNLDRRFYEHQSGLDRGCYTFDRRPLQLVHSSEFYDVLEAIRWEKQLKGWSRKKKAALAAGNWEAVKKLARPHFETRTSPSTTNSAKPSSAQDDKAASSARPSLLRVTRDEDFAHPVALNRLVLPDSWGAGKDFDERFGA